MAYVSTIDTAFLMISMLVVMITFIGLLLALFLSLQQRRRDWRFYEPWVLIRPNYLYYLC